MPAAPLLVGLTGWVAAGVIGDRLHRDELAQPGEAARYFGHTGGNWGFRSNLEAEIEGGKGLVIMANSGESNPIIFGELATRIKEQYAW